MMQTDLASSRSSDMAFIRKIPVIHYVDEEGRRVKSSTPGAIRVETESKKWYGCYRIGGRQKQIPLSADKQSAQAMLAKLLKSLERGKAGLTSPFQKHLDRPILEHLDKYLPVLRQRVRNDKYYAETVRILKCIISQSGIAVLGDLDTDKIEDYLTCTKAAPNTKKKHHSAIGGFVKWLVKRKLIERNFVLTVDVPLGGVVKKLRSLNASELQDLLDTTRERPLQEALMIRRGKRKGQLLARVRPEVQERLQQEGRERALLYKTAVMTGLRREELKALIVFHMDFAHKPYPLLTLPGKFTKNGLEAKLLLVPSFAEELSEYIADTGKQPREPMFRVPEKINLIFRRDLKAARIAEEDESGAMAKFRSLRKSANMLLGRAGVPVKIRQLFMRHSDIRLTMETYDDTATSELAQAVEALAQIRLK
jgi:integrase